MPGPFRARKRPGLCMHKGLGFNGSLNTLAVQDKWTRSLNRLNRKARLSLPWWISNPVLELEKHFLQSWTFVMTGASLPCWRVVFNTSSIKRTLGEPCQSINILELRMIRLSHQSRTLLLQENPTRIQLDSARRRCDTFLVRTSHSGQIYIPGM